MLALWRIRAIVAEITAELPAAAPFPDVAAIGEQIRAFAGLPGVEVLDIGAASDGTPLRAIGIAPPGEEPAPGMLVVGVPRGDMPHGVATILALAHRLGNDAALRAELGVRWWFLPCLDPAGARANNAWWQAPLALDRYAREVVVGPPLGRLGANGAVPLPEQRALLELIDRARPGALLFLQDTPTGGFALHERAGVTGELWRGRADDFSRLIDPLGLPRDLGGASSPAVPSAPALYPLDLPDDRHADPYARFRAAYLTPSGGEWLHLAPAGVPTGALLAPLFVDYARREHDRTTLPESRRAVIAEGIRLWREWFAFGRTTLDLLAVLPSLGPLANDPILLDALAGADTILAAGLGWAALVPAGDAAATQAEAFAHGDAIRLARLMRLAVLVRALAEAYTRFAHDPPGALADALDRATEMQARWIDELAGAASLRPVRHDRAVAAQLGAILLALPDR